MTTEYEDMVMLLQDKEITPLEFIRRQPELNEHFTTWCNENHIETVNDNTANIFFTLIDEAICNPTDFELV